MTEPPNPYERYEKTGLSDMQLTTLRLRRIKQWEAFFPNERKEEFNCIESDAASIAEIRSPIKAACAKTAAKN